VVLARVIRYFGEVWLGVTLGHESTSYLKTHLWQFRRIRTGRGGAFAVLYGLVFCAAARHDQLLLHVRARLTACAQAPADCQSARLPLNAAIATPATLDVTCGLSLSFRSFRRASFSSHPPDARRHAAFSRYSSIVVTTSG